MTDDLISNEDIAINEIKEILTKLEENKDYEIDFLAYMKKLKDFVDDNFKQRKSKLEKESNGSFRTGQSHVLEWSTGSGRTTLDRNALKSHYGESEIAQFEKVGRPVTTFRIKPLFTSAVDDETKLEKESN